MLSGLDPEGPDRAFAAAFGDRSCCGRGSKDVKKRTERSVLPADGAEHQDVRPGCGLGSVVPFIELRIQFMRPLSSVPPLRTSPAAQNCRIRPLFTVERVRISPIFTKNEFTLKPSLLSPSYLEFLMPWCCHPKPKFSLLLFQSDAV